MAPRLDAVAISSLWWQELARERSGKEGRSFANVATTPRKAGDFLPNKPKRRVPADAPGKLRRPGQQLAWGAEERRRPFSFLARPNGRTVTDAGK
jgi:hypothetical protein